MCDYSMHHVKNRKAEVGDKIITSNFGGRSSPGLESMKPGEQGVAICLIPGTGIEFQEPVKYMGMDNRGAVSDFKIAKYFHAGRPGHYNDTLRFADGTSTLIAYILPGQIGTVTYVPEEVVKQTNEAEPVAKTMRRRLADVFG